MARTLSPAAPATAKQMAYLRALAATIYTDEEIRRFIGGGLSKAAASDAIEALKAAGCRTERDKQRAPRRRSGGSGTCRAAGCHNAATLNARHHRAMGGYCGYCAFDEFDC